MYKAYSQLDQKQKAQVGNMFHPAFGDPNNFVYEFTRSGDVLCRKAKTGWTYRGHKIHWNNVKECWRFYQRIADRQDAIDTMSPENDIDTILEMQAGHA